MVGSIFLQLAACKEDDGQRQDFERVCQASVSVRSRNVTDAAESEFEKLVSDVDDPLAS